MREQDWNRVWPEISNLSRHPLSGASGENDLEERCGWCSHWALRHQNDFRQTSALRFVWTPNYRNHGRIAILMPRLDSNGSACRPTVPAD
jgi:hypothetical protein